MCDYFFVSLKQSQNLKVFSTIYYRVSAVNPTIQALTWQVEIYLFSPNVRDICFFLWLPWYLACHFRHLLILHFTHCTEINAYCRNVC